MSGNPCKSRVFLVSEYKKCRPKRAAFCVFGDYSGTEFFVLAFLDKVSARASEAFRSSSFKA